MIECEWFTYSSVVSGKNRVGWTDQNKAPLLPPIDPLTSKMILAQVVLELLIQRPALFCGGQYMSKLVHHSFMRGAFFVQCKIIISMVIILVCVLAAGECNRRIMRQVRL